MSITISLKTVREIEGHPRKALTMAQDQQGEKHGELHEVMTCWEEHLFFFFFKVASCKAKSYY